VNRSSASASATVRRRSLNEAAHKLGDPPERESDGDIRDASPHHGQLDVFLAGLSASEPPVNRVPGTAIFLIPEDGVIPPALQTEVERTGALPDRVLVVYVQRTAAPQTDGGKTVLVEARGPGRLRILHVTIRTSDSGPVNVPAALHLARKRGLLERNLDLEHATYFTPPAADT
jgi:KUP system potassium uptake protein